MTDFIGIGYGIVRPKLMKSEWLSISIVSILYLWAAILSQVADILEVEQNDKNDHHRYSYISNSIYV